MDSHQIRLLSRLIFCRSLSLIILPLYCFVFLLFPTLKKRIWIILYWLSPLILFFKSSFILLYLNFFLLKWPNWLNVNLNWYFDEDGFLYFIILHVNYSVFSCWKRPFIFFNDLFRNWLVFSVLILITGFSKAYLLFSVDFQGLCHNQMPNGQFFKIIFLV